MLEFNSSASSLKHATVNTCFLFFFLRNLLCGVQPLEMSRLNMENYQKSTFAFV